MPSIVLRNGENAPNLTAERALWGQGVGLIAGIDEVGRGAWLGLLLRLEHVGEGYDAEGRVQKIDYNKLDYGTDFAFFDVTDDCQVNEADINQIINRQGRPVGDPQYGARYDLNSDGVINLIDLIAVQAMSGKSCPRFVYDADGTLTKLEGPQQIVYVGGIYEKNLDSGEVDQVLRYDGGPAHSDAQRSEPALSGERPS